VNSDIENGRIKPDAPKEQLYDLEADLSQSRNVILEHPELTNKMKIILDSLCALK